MLPGQKGRLLDRDCLAKPLPLVKDGDLVTLGSPRSRVMPEADTAADLGRRHQSELIMDAKALFA